MVASSGTLLAVLDNPPLTDGTRTLRRVDLTLPWVAKNRPLETTTAPPTAATATQKDD